MAQAGGHPQGMPLWQIDQGEFTNVPSVSVPELGASETMNVVSFDGRVRPRPGFQPSTITPPAIDPDYNPLSSIVHICPFITNTQFYHILRCQAAGGSLSVYQFNRPGTPWFKIDQNPLTFQPGQRISSCQFGGTWLLCTGSNNLQSWDGAAMQDVTAQQANISNKAPSAPQFVVGTGSRVFLANAIDPNSGNRVPYRVWWSTTLDHTIWSNGAGLPSQGSAGYIDLIQGRDSSPITGMYFQGATQVIVFKRHSIYRGAYLGGPVWYTFYSVTQSRGCVAPGSIQCFNDVLIWLGDDYNVYTLDMSGSIRPIGAAIRPRIQKFFDPAFNSGSSVNSVLDVVLGLYYLIIPYQDVDSGKVLSRIFVCNLNSGAWSEGQLADPNVQITAAFWLHSDPPFFVDAPVATWGFSDGSIYSTDYAQPKMIDKTTPFDAWWWSKTHDFLQLNSSKYGPPLQSNNIGEVAEFSKIALHGRTGTAIPRFRMGANIPQVDNSTYSYNFDAVTQEAKLVEAYSGSCRVDPNRFGQVGVYWAKGTPNPMVVDGITTWGIPRMGDVR